MQLSQTDGKPPDSSDIVLPGGGYREVNVTITMNYPPKYDRYGTPTYMKSTAGYSIVTITPSGFMTLPLVINNNAISVTLEVRHNSVITSTNKFVNVILCMNVCTPKCGYTAGKIKKLKNKLTYLLIYQFINHNSQ